MQNLDIGRLQQQYLLRLDISGLTNKSAEPSSSQKERLQTLVATFKRDVLVDHPELTIVREAVAGGMHYTLFLSPSVIRFSHHDSQNAVSFELTCEPFSLKERGLEVDEKDYLDFVKYLHKAAIDLRDGKAEAYAA